MNTIINKVKQGYMSTVIMSLLQANNTISTLEVKDELRKLYPEFSWLQRDVSTFMNDMHLAGDLTYDDNGTFRTYSGEAKKKTSTKKDKKGKKLSKIKATPISKKAALELMLNNKGYFFTAEYTKKNGDFRVMNCQCITPQDTSLGYVKVKEASLMRTDPKNCIRQINMQTLKALKIGGKVYKIK